jgi:hypothetical protein
VIDLTENLKSRHSRAYQEAITERDNYRQCQFSTGPNRTIFHVGHFLILPLTSLPQSRLATSSFFRHSDNNQDERF